jgi:predicted Na+-dependent transporter
VAATFSKYLQLLTPSHFSVEFTVPFNNGTATADLGAVFSTPDPARALPMMVFILGTGG